MLRGSLIGFVLSVALTCFHSHAEVNSWWRCAVAQFALPSLSDEQAWGISKTDFTSKINQHSIVTAQGRVYLGEIEIIKTGKPDSRYRGTWKYFNDLYAQKLARYFASIKNGQSQFRHGRYWIDVSSETKREDNIRPFRTYWMKGTLLSLSDVSCAVGQRVKTFEAKHFKAIDPQLRTGQSQDWKRRLEEDAKFIEQQMAQALQSHVSFIEINYTRSSKFPNEPASPLQAHSLITPSELEIGRALSTDRANVLIVLRCFHPYGFIFEAAFFNGAQVKKYQYL